jgi:hypothetical protein
MRSKINLSLPLSDTKWVISLVYHGYHARLLIEKLSDDGSYYIGTADYLPYDNKNYCVLYGADMGQLLANKTCSGIVRSYPVSGLPQGFDREDIFNKLKLEKFKGITWQVSSVNGQNMMNAINKQKSSHETSPRFNIKGYYNNVGVGHNCCTWAIEILKLAAVYVNKQYTNNSLGILSLVLPEIKDKYLNALTY